MQIACGYGFSAKLTTKCLYKRGTYNNIIGCRNLEHLQDCGMKLRHPFVVHSQKKKKTRQNKKGKK